MTEVVLIVFASIVTSIWIVAHYLTQWKAQNRLTEQDSSSLNDMRKNSDRLEDRIRVLERILDEDMPDWRTRK